LIGFDPLGITRLLFENFQNPQNKPNVNNRSDVRTRAVLGIGGCSIDNAVAVGEIAPEVVCLCVGQ
jgi:hypothetical protein